MTKKINELKFNFTSQMASLLIKYNELKKEYRKTNESNLFLNLLEPKREFIKVFRENNKKEIEKFMTIKDQL